MRSLIVGRCGAFYLSRVRSSEHLGAAAGLDWFGNHELYISNPFIVTDLRKLLEFNVRPPTARSKAIVEGGKPTERYWVFVPPEAASAPH